MESHNIAKKRIFAGLCLMVLSFCAVTEAGGWAIKELVIGI